jgi:hypothetical protein
MGSPSTSLRAGVLRAGTSGASGVGRVPDLPVSAFELDAWSLGRVQVHRELNNIDVLLLYETHRLTVLVENIIAIGSTQTSWVAT